MSRAVIALVIALGTLSYAQPVGNDNFLIDQTKPYVYLKFDHIGPRIPIEKGEGKVGLWLRVVNNCRIPIVFMSLGKADGAPGVRLTDEVVDVEPVLEIAFTEEQKKEARERERLRKSKHKPVGYSSETGGVVRVQPGEDVLFSVPVNHVDDDWYMRVKFALDLNRSSVSQGPFTYLPFYKWDIPREFRPGQ